LRAPLLMNRTLPRRADTPTGPRAGLCTSGSRSPLGTGAGLPRYPTRRTIAPPTSSS
jgi:hypothetical protein